MDVVIQQASPEDEQVFRCLSQELSRFNRRHHPQSDSFDAVLQARANRARQLLRSANSHQLILMAKVGGKDVGYALVGVDYPDPSNDNGTNLCGLLDEVYVDENVQGLGVESGANRPPNLVKGGRRIWFKSATESGAN